MDASKEKLYYVIDNVITGVNHVTSNAGCINLLQYLHPGHATIKIWGEQGHIRALSEKVIPLNGNQVQYSEIPVIEPHLKPWLKLPLWIRKIRNDNRWLKKLLTGAGVELPDMIFFCSITPINLLLYRPLFREHPDKKLLITLHGEIEYLFRNDLSYKERIQKIMFIRAFSGMPANVSYLVLSKAIYDKLKASDIIPADKLLYIEHPLNEDKGLVSGQRKLQQVPVFAHIGGATVKKNAQQIFELAGHFRNEVENKQVQFRILGTLFEDIKKFRNPWVVALSDNGKMVDREHYETAVSQTDYCLVFITGNNYLYRVSGATLDALQYHIPIIALQHEFVQRLFERGGDIGFICDSPDAMTRLIQRIINKDPEILDRYAQQVRNLEALAREHYPGANARLLRNELMSKGWEL